MKNINISDIKVLWDKESIDKIDLATTRISFPSRFFLTKIPL